MATRYAPRSPEYWADVHMDYMGNEKMVDIYRRHDLTKGEFDYHRRIAGWPMRNKAPVNREKLVGRIFWLINHHIARLETNMESTSQADAALLNQLVGSLGRLIRFESGAAAGKKRSSRDLQDIREKLVRRIEELKSN